MSGTGCWRQKRLDYFFPVFFPNYVSGFSIPSQSLRESNYTIWNTWRNELWRSNSLCVCRSVYVSSLTFTKWGWSIGSEKAIWEGILFFLFLLFTTVLSQWDFYHGKFGLPFPGESQLRQSRATQLTVHGGCFSVFIIHRTLTWTTGSLTCT